MFNVTIKYFKLAGTWTKKSMTLIYVMDFLILLRAYYNNITPFAVWIESISQEKKFRA